MATLESLQKEIEEMKKDLLTLKKSDGPKKPKQKRKPSAYNLYMKEALPRVKAENPTLTHNEAFKLAAGQFKTHKEAEVEN